MPGATSKRYLAKLRASDPMRSPRSRPRTLWGSRGRAHPLFAALDIASGPVTCIRLVEVRLSARRALGRAVGVLKSSCPTQRQLGAFTDAATTAPIHLCRPIPPRRS